MKSDIRTFKQLVKLSERLIIPVFQRNYIWEESDWQILLDDILGLVETNSYHFIGSLVLVSYISDNETEIIDGQQRITTIFILLSALRDLIEDNNEDLKDEIQDLLFNHPRKRIEQHIILNLKNEDRDIFNNILLSQNNDALNSKLIKAYNFFLSKLKSQNSNLFKNKTFIQLLFERIRDNIQFIQISLEEKDDIGNVFDRINSTGKKLNESDLLRNYFLNHIKDRHKRDEIYQNSIKPLESHFQNDDFIRYYLEKNGDDIKNKNIFSELKNRIDDRIKHSSNKGDIKSEELEKIKKNSVYYETIENPQDKELDKNIKERLIDFNRLEVASSKSYLLNCYEEYKEKRLTPDNFTTILTILENYIVRSFVCGLSSSKVETIFRALCVDYTKKKQQKEHQKEGSNNKSTSIITKDSVEKILINKGYPLDMEFKKYFLERPIYVNGEQAKVKFILSKINHKMGNSNKESIDCYANDNDRKKRITIEHIMPHKLNDIWKQNLGERWEIIHRIYVDTLGNLTLTAYNSQLSNSDFGTKKEIFKESYLPINDYFNDINKWEERNIKDRGYKLLEYALDIWENIKRSNKEEDSEKQHDANPTYVKPNSLNFLDSRISVKSWYEVLEHTIAKIQDEQGYNFNLIIGKFSDIIRMEGVGKKWIKSQVGNFYLKSNLSDIRISEYCSQILREVKLREQWTVELGSIVEDKR